MKKIFLLAAVFLFSAMGFAGATTYTFIPPNPDLGDLDHNYYYRWGMDFNLPVDETISSASLFFDDIYNWDSNPNDLYVHLLDWVPLDISIGYDNQGGGDYFDTPSGGTEILLNHWENLSTTPQDLTYDFNSEQIGTLTNYLLDDRVGLGFDPDCHYYNNGVTLTITTHLTSEGQDPPTQSNPVPEPSTMCLLFLGLMGLTCLKRKSRG